MVEESTVSEADLEKYSSRVSEILLNLAAERGTEKTFCPSEAARRLEAGDWRRHMPLVRTIGVQLIRENKLRVFQIRSPPRGLSDTGFLVNATS